jgi:predicted permease
MTLHDRLVGRSKAWMFMLLAAVGVVLLIACVNVANLMLARAMTRSREVGIRAALGASRWQLARALLAESLVLSVAGTLCGIIVAWWGVGVLRAALPANLPRIAEIAIDFRVLAAAVVAAIGTGIAFGLVPAVQHSRPDLTQALREEGRSGAAGAVRQRLRSALVIAEVVLAVILLVGSGLFISSFVRLVQIDLGLDFSRVLTVSVYPRSGTGVAGTGSREAEQARWQTTMAALHERLRQMPNVEAVGLISGSGLPLTGSWSRTSVQVLGNPQEFRDSDSVDVNRVSPEYLNVMGLRLTRGRFVDHSDTAEAPPVIVINEFAARQYLGDRDPLGAVLIITKREHTVVGVTANTRRMGPETDFRPEAYFPVLQTSSTGGDFVIKTRGAAEDLAPAAKAAVRSVLPDLIVPAPQTLEQLYAQLVAQRKFNMLLLGLFGVLAIAIAAAGIYGVMAYLVEQRTAEIGVRLALGAVPGGILRMVLGRAALLLGVGLIGGLATAFAVSRWIQQFLFEVKPHDPIVYISVGALLVAIGLLAAFVPARRASRVDPLVALR